MAYYAETAETLHRHVIVWLNKDTGQPGDNEPMKERFCRVTHPIETFMDVQPAVDFICQQQAAEKSVFLIVSDELGREIVPQIFDLEYVAQIFIFCDDMTKHSTWIQRYKNKLQLFHSDELLLIELTNTIAKHLIEEANRRIEVGQVNMAVGLLEWADYLYVDVETLHRESCHKIRANIKDKLRKLGSDHYDTNDNRFNS